MKRVIVITGTPGVGKTEVSKVLAEKLNAEYLNLTEVAKKGNFIIEFDRERDTFVVDSKKLRSFIVDFISSHKSWVVVDSHYAYDVVPIDYVFMVFVLRCNPYKLKKRLMKRGYSGKKLYENVQAEILDVCLYESINAYGEKLICEIDVSDKNVREIVDEIISVISGKKKPQIGVVDWLGLLESQEKLNEFFSHY